jgi:SAM-dependent methyltransferase
MSADLDALRSAYERLEPAGTDTWNPVVRGDLELWHRVRLLIEATHAMRLVGRDPGTLRVLDVGCGVGRSSRLLVDLGVPPQSIVAIDLRPDAVAVARTLNPAIDFRAIRSFAEWPAGEFDLCVQCTAFSSLPGGETRGEAARLMNSSAGKRGHVYWWDCILANDFAGGGALDPEGLFPSRSVVLSRRVSLYPTFEEAAASLPRGARHARRLLKLLPFRQTHQTILFGPER